MWNFIAVMVCIPAGLVNLYMDNKILGVTQIAIGIVNFVPAVEWLQPFLS